MHSRILLPCSAFRAHLYVAVKSIRRARRFPNPKRPKTNLHRMYTFVLKGYFFFRLSIPFVPLFNARSQTLSCPALNAYCVLTQGKSERTLDKRHRHYPWGQRQTKSTPCTRTRSNVQYCFRKRYRRVRKVHTQTPRYDPLNSVNYTRYSALRYSRVRRLPSRSFCT